MSKAVFTTKMSSDYDDLPEIRYHFPRTYLNQVQESIGDWILYYEPRRPTSDASSRGGRQVYFATAQVQSISQDPNLPDHFYAKMSNFLPFSRPVPFKEGTHYYETALQKHDGSTNKGAFGRAVRTLPDKEYDLIWQAGFAHVLGLEERAREAPDIAEEPPSKILYAAEDSVDYIPDSADRGIARQMTSRLFRDRAFSVAVKSAYSDTCAMTGLKIINGGGRSEVQAAHIRPVAEFGPDSVRNGVALSGTMHWMFDRHLVSIDDNLDILVAKDRLPDTVLRLLNEDLRLLVPTALELQPHQKFLSYHRRQFKG